MARRKPAKAPSVDSTALAPVRRTPDPAKAERALKRKEMASTEEREWWDRAERFLGSIMSSPAASFLTGGVMGGAGGVLAHEPTHISLKNLFLARYEDPTRISRIVATYVVENLYTHTLRFPGISVPSPIGGAIGLIPASGWPDEWTVSINFPLPGPTSEEALAAAERKLLSALRAYGFAAGSAFGLGMVGVAGLGVPTRAR